MPTEMTRSSGIGFWLMKHAREANRNKQSEAIPKRGHVATELHAKGARNHSVVSSPFEAKKSDHAKSQHRVGYMSEARDIGTRDVIAR